MNKKQWILYISFFYLLIFSNVFSFYKKLIPDLSFNESDSLYKLSINNFKENPAWLTNLWRYDYIQFSTSTINSWGDYKRRFDAEGNHVNNIGFSGQTKLDEKSVFYGESSYIFDFRSNQNRSLRYTTYTGEAFFFTDTTKGNFLYHGPNIGFAYCFQVLPKLDLGLKLNYNLLDGIKSNYSQAQTVIRNIVFKGGLSFSPLSSFTVGTTLDYFDSQESIEAKGNASYIVDIFNYRGDLHSILNRGNNLKQVVKEKGTSVGLQILFEPSSVMQVGLKGQYTNFNLQDILTDLKNEDVYSDFNIYNAEFESNYLISSDFCLRNNINFIYSQSWSQHSSGNFLIWKWYTNSLIYNVGLTYNLKEPNILLNLDYKINYFTADSQKYIDNRFINLNTNNHYFSFGAEHEISSHLLIHSIVDIGRLNIDPLLGGKDVSVLSFNIGTGITVTKSILALLDLYYIDRKEKNNILNKENFNLFFKIKILR